MGKTGAKTGGSEVWEQNVGREQKLRRIGIFLSTDTKGKKITAAQRTLGACAASARSHIIAGLRWRIRPRTFSLRPCRLSQHLGRQLASPPLPAAITLIITPVNHLHHPPPEGWTERQLGQEEERGKKSNGKWTLTRGGRSRVKLLKQVTDVKRKKTH